MECAESCPIYTIRVIPGVILNLVSLCYGLLSGLGSLLRMFFFLCSTSSVGNKLCYTGDEPTINHLNRVLKGYFLL